MSRQQQMATKQYFAMIVVLFLMIALTMGRSYYADELDDTIAEIKRELFLRRLLDVLIDKRMYRYFLISCIL